MMKKLGLALISVLCIFTLLFTGCTGGESSSSVAEISSVTADASSDTQTSNDTETSSAAETSSAESSTPVSSSKPVSSQTASSKPVSSKPVSSVTPSSSAPASSAETSSEEPEETEMLTISCWGDSITESMGMSEADRYPAVLNNLLGYDKYIVLNGGDGGEDTTTIMARQGAVKIYTSDEIVFKAGETKVHIGNGDGNGFETKDGKVIRLTQPLGRDMSVNAVTIGGELYQIVLENFNWDGRTCEVYLKRTADTDKAITIKKGTEAKFASADIAKTNHCDIYFMGANGGYDDDINKLISQYQAMIDYRGNDNYLIIIPYWSSEFTAPFKKAFGDHAVDFAEAAVNGGLNKVGITATSRDRELLSRNQIPASFKYQYNPSDVHLSAHGYKLLATVLYERGAELGYWE